MLALPVLQPPGCLGCHQRATTPGSAEPRTRPHARASRAAAHGLLLPGHRLHGTAATRATTKDTPAATATSSRPAPAPGPLGTQPEASHTTAEAPSTSSGPPSPSPGPPPLLGAIDVSHVQLLGVAFLWGSYNSTVSWLYASEHALNPSTLTAIRTVLSAAALGLAAYVGSRSSSSSTAASSSSSNGSSSSSSSSSSASSTSSSNGSADATQVGAQGTSPSALRGQEEASTSSSSNGAASTVATNGRGLLAAASDVQDLPLLARTFQGVIPAGIELGLWNFFGAALQASGLMLTSATRTGFLMQLTAVATPLLSALAGNSIPTRTIAAAALALMGTVLITVDGADKPLDTAAGLPALNTGDLMCLAACLFFSLATVRLSMYAPRFPAIQLATAKKVTLGTASLGWLAVTTSSAQSAANGAGLGGLEALWQQTPLEWSVILYSALGPGALAAFLQTSGQARCPATTAQVIFSFVPVIGAVAAWLFLGDEEVMGPMAWTGGAVILVASVLATAGGSNQGAGAKAKP